MSSLCGLQGMLTKPLVPSILLLALLENRSGIYFPPVFHIMLLNHLFSMAAGYLGRIESSYPAVGGLQQLGLKNKQIIVVKEQQCLSRENFVESHFGFDGLIPSLSELTLVLKRAEPVLISSGCRRLQPSFNPLYKAREAGELLDDPSSLLSGFIWISVSM